MKEFVVEDLPFGVTCIDTGLMRERLACCYLLQEGDAVAVIETGTRHTVPRILSVLDSKGIKREQVEYVIVTHVHLDHAGGAGALLQHLPKAKLVVHPRGARHMIDPQKLQAGTAAVYGEDSYQENYGDLVPVEKSRVIVAEDDYQLLLNGRLLKFLDTPGHARHHFCVYDEKSQGIFSGDTLGLVYRELTFGYSNFVLPSTTPVQFDPDALRESVRKLLALNPERAFLTHYSMVEHIEEHSEKLLLAIEQYEVIAELHIKDDPKVRQENIRHSLMKYTLSELEKNGCALSLSQAQQLLNIDMELNSQGLEVWLQRKEKLA